MILFLEDWKKYPTAIMDTKTKNQSFVRLASVYRAMGIKNHAFLLALVNPALQGVDPHDPTLTIEQIGMITMECNVNPWYFFREVARAPALAGNVTSHLKANRGNICLFWSFFNHVRITLIQIRQTGKSFNTDVLMRYLMNVLCKNTDINLMTKDDQLRRANIERLKDIEEALPYYMRRTTRADANNGEELTVKALGNIYRTHVPQMNKMQALNKGRGLSSPVMLVDEGPFQANIDIALPAALPAMGAAVEMAEAAGEPHGVIFTTTAGKLNEPSGRFFYDLLQASAVWDERFLDAENQKQLHEIIRRSTRDDSISINATFSHRQLGYSDEWLRDKMKKALSKGDAAERDYLNRWTSGTEGSPFTPDVADRIKASEKSPQFLEIDPKHHFTLRWHIPEAQIERFMAANSCVMGMDSSEASGGDFIGITITDVRTLATVATATLNDINVYSFVEWIADLLERFPTITFVPERRSTGSVIIDGLLKLLPRRGIDPFKRIFNWVFQNPDKYRDRYNQIIRTDHSRASDIYTMNKGLFGFATSGGGETSRSRLYTSTMSLATTRFAERVLDTTLISQLLGLEIRNGRIDHSAKGHDDLVIAWLMGVWLLTSGHNLQLYGIDSSIAMSVPVERKTLTREETFEHQKLSGVKNRIRTLLEQLSTERDQYVSQRLEQELVFLDRQVPQDENEVYSIQELIRQAGEQRRRAVTRRSTSSNQSYYRMAA